MSGGTEKTNITRTTSESSIHAEEIKQKMDPDNKDQASADLRSELKMTEHITDAEELLLQLNTNIETGLTAQNVLKVRGIHGYNRLTPPKGDPEWLKFIRTQTGFFSLLLWGGAILCFIGYGLKKEVDNLYLGIVLSLVVFGTGVFSYLQERKSDNLMEQFKNMMTTETLVTRDGEISKIDASELVVGDIVSIKYGDKIPADLRVLECTEDMKVDNACLTGEAEPIQRVPHNTHANPLETKNLCFFGTLVPSGTAKCVVVKTGDNTVMGRIAKLATETTTTQSPINLEIEHFVFIVSGVAITLGITFFIIGAALGTDWITNLVFMIGIIVANVPEGLLATVTVCLTLTAKRMHTKMVLVKNLEAVETLGSTTCICSDKTGTLTQNIMTVANLVYDQKIWECECSMYADKNFDNNDASFAEVLKVLTVANNATFEGKFKKKIGADGKMVVTTEPQEFEEMVTLGDGSQEKRVMWGTNGDASESAMIKIGQKYVDIMEMRKKSPAITEMPFNSKNKYMLKIVQGSEGPEVLMKGAPERIISRCSTILLNGEEVEYTPEMVAETEALQLTLSKMGRRVLGMCKKSLSTEDYPEDYAYSIENPNFPMGDKREDVQWDANPEPNERRCDQMCFLGLAALIDPPRPQVPPAVAKCKTAGIKVVMVTGDHPETAKAIAKEVGIIWGDTKSDVEDRNTLRNLSAGDAGYEDPDLAPAIVVPGWTINNTDTTTEVWDDILDHQQIVFARTSPQQKLIIVENFQRRGHTVAVTGDGVNDAPALKKADIGVAMGIMGSDVSKEAADMILIDDNFASIVSGVEEGRLIFDNLKKSIAYTLSSNIPEISPFLAFITVQVPLPLSTILILCIDLGTDMIPAISMAWENPENDIMRRPPRDAKTDRLVTMKLVNFSYLQIGVIQAASGFYSWMVVLNDYGYPPHILPSLGAQDNWGKQQLYCKLTGGILYNLAGDLSTPFANSTFNTNVAAGFMFWDAGTNGEIETCSFAAKTFRGSASSAPGTWTEKGFSAFTDYTAGNAVVSMQSIQLMRDQGYVEYLPFKARQSNFFDKNWLTLDPFTDYSWQVTGSGVSVFDTIFYSVTPYGFWTTTGTGGDNALASGKVKEFLTPATEKIFPAATYSIPANITQELGGLPTSLYTWTVGNTVNINAAGRMMQKEALAHSQTAGFICIIVVQWADLTICKTRWLSIRDQGMRNPAMNFGLLFETILGAALCYLPLNVALGTRPLRLTHWFPGMPFSVIIFTYDEIRKYFMRKTSPSMEDKETGRIVRQKGWLERNTYY